MMGIKQVTIADIETVRDIETGDTTKAVKDGVIVAGRVDLVGVNTAQLGQIQGFTLSYSVEISRSLYRKQKYLLFDDELFTIRTLSKAKNPNNMLLNVQELEDEDIKEAINIWKQSQSSTI